MPRTMKTEDSLGARYPSVAAMWHPDRNGSRTPENTTAGNSYRAWWRCPAGHEWDESVHARTLLKPWKDGDRAACRVCTGFHVIVTFACGHTAEVKAEHRNPERDSSACRNARWEQRLADAPANSAAAKRLYAECGDQAHALLDSLPIPGLAGPLLLEWRTWALTQLRLAVVADQQFGKADALDRALAEVQRGAEMLRPTVEDLRAAVSDRRPVHILGKAHWPTGWLYHLGTLHAPVQADDCALVGSAACRARRRDRRRRRPVGEDRQLQTTSVTRILTEAIRSWAYEQGPSHGQSAGTCTASSRCR